MRKAKAKDTPNVVTGTLCIKTQYVHVLFDSSATHSFISVKLVEILGLVPTSKPHLLSVTLPNRKTLKFDELYKDCPIQMYEHVFLRDLYKFKLTNFSVILEWNG